MMLMSIASMAVDPAVVAVCGTVGGGILLKVTEGYLSKSKTLAEVPADPEEVRIEGLARAILEDDSFGGCTLEYQRHFEQTLIEAGIKTELSKCYDERCETCHPKARNEAPEIGTVSSRGRKNKYLTNCGTCGKDVEVGSFRATNTPTTCRPCARQKSGGVPHGVDRLKSLQAEKKRANEAFQKSRAGKNRTAVVSGRILPIPGNVPKTATAHVEYDMFAEMSVVWSWEVDGKRMYFRQRTSPEILDEFPLASKAIPTTGTIKAGDTWINSGGISKCEPCDEPMYMNQYFKEHKSYLRAEEYELENTKKRIQELEFKTKMLKNSMMTIDEMREDVW